MSRWVALHRRDGAELTEADAPGYQRRPWLADIGVRWPAAKADWGRIAWCSVWDRKQGGRCISSPRLQPMTALLGAKVEVAP